MGIFERLENIITANLNDWADNLENPEAMLKQAVEEMEAAIGESKREVAKAMAAEKLVQRDLDANKESVRAWQARAEKAVLAKDESLARMALGRKQEYATLVAALEEQVRSTAETSSLLRQQLEAMQAKLAEAKRRLGTLTARLKAAEVRSKMSTVSGEVQLDQSAFQKFEKMRAKVERVEAEADAMRELDRALSSDPIPEPVAPRSDTSIDAELEALKRKLGS